MAKISSIQSFTRKKKKDVPRTKPGESYSFSFVTVPKGQPRMRHYLRKGKVADIGAWQAIGKYTPDTANEFKADLKIAAIEAGLMNKNLHGAIKLEVTFEMPRPKTQHNADGSLKPTAPKLYHEATPDLDNITKACKDALSDIRAWVDDSLVAKEILEKVYAEPNTAPQTHVCITVLDN